METVRRQEVTSEKEPLLPAIKQLLKDTQHQVYHVTASAPEFPHLCLAIHEAEGMVPLY